MKKNLLMLIAIVLLAINSFAKEGIYMEFKMTSKSFNGSIKSYSSGGDNLTESNMVGNYNGTSVSRDITSLKLQTDPDNVYTLNEQDKTYSVTNVSRVPDRNEDADYEITVLGKENVNHYNTTHVKLVNRKTQHEMEMWLTKDIPQYEHYTAVKNKYTGSNLYRQLKDKGAEGLAVRITMNEERTGPTQLDLVKAEERNIDPSMFSLGGYTRSGPAAPAPMPAGVNVNVNPTPAGVNVNVNIDAQKLQNMTPEEKQKYIEQLKQQYAPHQ